MTIIRRLLDLQLSTYIFYHFIDIDECLADPCDKNSACTNSDGSFTCTCNTGYNGDGISCAGEISWWNIIQMIAWIQ